MGVVPNWPVSTGRWRVVLPLVPLELWGKKGRKEGEGGKGRGELGEREKNAGRNSAGTGRSGGGRGGIGGHTAVALVIISLGAQRVAKSRADGLMTRDERRACGIVPPMPQRTFGHRTTLDRHQR